MGNPKVGGNGGNSGGPDTFEASLGNVNVAKAEGGTSNGETTAVAGAAEISDIKNKVRIREQRPDYKLENFDKNEKIERFGRATRELENFSTTEQRENTQEMIKEGGEEYGEVPVDATGRELQNPDAMEMPPEAGPADSGMLTEEKPLAVDGSSEGRLNKKKILVFDGETIDKDSLQYIEKQTKEYQDDPFELSNIRDRMMTEGLRDNYGRIFGDDGTSNGEEKKVEDRIEGEMPDRTMEFSELENIEMMKSQADEIPGMKEVTDEIDAVSMGGRTER